MIIPNFLHRGDKVGICCTARSVTPEIIQMCVDTLRAWGLIPVLGQNIYKQYHQFSGNDIDRAVDFQLFLDNPDIKAIIIGKGGYGTVRIIDKLDFSSFINNPKWVCGYSDITVLHSHIHSQLGIATLHSPMAVNFQQGSLKPEALEAFRAFLFGQWPSFSFENKSSFHNKTGKTKGQIVGGNLSIIYALSGSMSDIDLKGKILFLEDIDEYIYHIDRMMWQLKRSGKLANLAGLVVGGFTDMKDNTTPFGMDIESVILDAVREYNYPVAFGLSVGHILNNYPLPLGLFVELTVNSIHSEFTYLV